MRDTLIPLIHEALEAADEEGVPKVASALTELKKAVGGDKNWSTACDLVMSLLALDERVQFLLFSRSADHLPAPSLKSAELLLTANVVHGCSATRSLSEVWKIFGAEGDPPSVMSALQRAATVANEKLEVDVFETLIGASQRGYRIDTKIVELLSSPAQVASLPAEKVDGLRLLQLVERCGGYDEALEAVCQTVSADATTELKSSLTDAFLSLFVTSPNTLGGFEKLQGLASLPPYSFFLKPSNQSGTSAPKELSFDECRGRPAVCEEGAKREPYVAMWAVYLLTDTSSAPVSPILRANHDLMLSLVLRGALKSLWDGVGTELLPPAIVGDKLDLDTLPEEATDLRRDLVQEAEDRQRPQLEATASGRARKAPQKLEPTTKLWTNYSWAKKNKKEAPEVYTVDNPPSWLDVRLIALAFEDPLSKFQRGNFVSEHGSGSVGSGSKYPIMPEFIVTEALLGELLAASLCKPPADDSRDYGELVERDGWVARWRRIDGLRVPEIMPPLAFLPLLQRLRKSAGGALSGVQSRLPYVALLSGEMGVAHFVNAEALRIAEIARVGQHSMKRGGIL
jgi:hypothetical protein